MSKGLSKKQIQQKNFAKVFKCLVAIGSQVLGHSYLNKKKLYYFVRPIYLRILILAKKPENINAKVEYQKLVNTEIGDQKIIIKNKKLKKLNFKIKSRGFGSQDHYLS